MTRLSGKPYMYNILIGFGIAKKLVRLIKMYLNETYSRVRLGQFLSQAFQIHCNLKQEDELSPLLFNFALKYAMLRWAGHVACMEQSRNAYRVLVGKTEGKRPLGRPRHRWEDNIRMDLREVGCDPGEWIDLAEDRDQWRAYVRVVMNLWVP